MIGGLSLALGMERPLMRLCLVFLGIILLPQEATAAADGVVDVSLKIDTDGRVAECRVLRSSGYAKLDARTCAILRRTKRFEAKRYGGRGVAYERVETYRWQVPRAPKPVEPQIPETRIH
jgi:TonB family protein